MSRTLSRLQRFFSTAKKPLPRVVKPQPLQESNVNHVYCVPQSDIKSYFTQGFPKSLLKQSEAVGSVCWILREQSWSIIQKLKENESMPNGYSLYGCNKSGKTVCLLQIIHHCLNDNWIVVHIPSVFSWVHPKSEFKPGKDPDTYDVPNESCSWLQYFRAMNSKNLGQIKLSQPYVWTKKDHSSEGDDLLKAIELAVVRPNIATDVVSCVLHELSQLESHKVLLAIDDFNGCFVPKSFKLDKTEWISANRISFVQHLLDYVNSSKFGGPVVTALSTRHLRNQYFDSYDYKTLLSNEGLEMTKDFEFIDVPHFSKNEFKECLENYHRSRLLSVKVDSKVFNELWQLSNGNPGELDKLCRSY